MTLYRIYNGTAPPEGEPAATVSYDAGTIENPNNYADGAVVDGAGIGVTILDGHLDFGSNQEFRDMTIQAAEGSPSIANLNGSSGTTFRRCRFRGGGGEGYYGPNLYLGLGNDLADLIFIDCEIERSLGAGDNNVITMYATSGTTIDTVTFDGCHFGVTNGSASGAARMMAEIWTAHGATGWKNMTFTGCEFEATDKWCLDFACYTDSVRATGVLVEDCLFHGAGIAGSSGYGIALEWPDDVTITGNTFYVCRDGGIVPGGSYMGENTDTYWSFTGNTFDWDTAEGDITAAFAPLALASNHNTVTGNTFNCHYDIPWYGLAPMVLWWGFWLGADLHGNTVTGNTFNLNATCPVTRAANSAVEANQTYSAAANTINRS